MNSEITFYKRFEENILNGKKTITIRDANEKDYDSGTTVDVSTFEDNLWFCSIIILSVVPVKFNELNEFHAEQENMTLEELKKVIHAIYHGIEELYIISFELVKS